VHAASLDDANFLVVLPALASCESVHFPLNNSHPIYSSSVIQQWLQWGIKTLSLGLQVPRLFLAQDLYEDGRVPEQDQGSTSGLPRSWTRFYEHLPDLELTRGES
jgi:hypothetical protein